MIFFIDTNMLYEPKKLNELARVCERAHHEVVMSALVLAERLNQVRRRGQDVLAAEAGLKQLIARVIPFDDEEAARAANALAHASRSSCGALTPDQYFQQIKLRRLCAAIGVEREHAESTRSTKKYPATVDIYLAGQVLARANQGAVMVTLDSGENSEFKALNVPICTLDDAIMRASETLPTCP